LENIDIDIDKDNLKNIDIDIDIDMAILENIDIDIDIDKGILQNIDIDKISYRLGFGISNTPTEDRKPKVERCMNDHPAGFHDQCVRHLHPQIFQDWRVYMKKHWPATQSVERGEC